MLRSIDIDISVAYSYLKFDNLMNKFFVNDYNIFKNNFQLDLIINPFLYFHIFDKFKQ